MNEGLKEGLSGVKTEMSEFAKKGIDLLGTYGGKILFAIVVFVVGYFIIRLLGRKPLHSTYLT